MPAGAIPKPSAGRTWPAGRQLNSPDIEPSRANILNLRFYYASKIADIIIHLIQLPKLDVVKHGTKMDHK